MSTITIRKHKRHYRHIDKQIFSSLVCLYSNHRVGMY